MTDDKHLVKGRRYKGEEQRRLQDISRYDEQREAAYPP